ncbi:MAG: hypothetical protein IK151_10100 [Erysipelotrichaceae bacterium]|nr:hypothetical protein [Erysipelotrichaceae bacterium]
MNKKEMLAVMGKVFAEYSKNYDPQTSIADEETLHDADLTYNYLFQLVNNDISKSEKEEIKSSNRYFEIYQIKNDLPDRRDISFISIGELEQIGKEVDRNNYDEVYTGEYHGERLDEIYEIFNVRHPADFKGHSLSVSDVVVIHDKDEAKAYYVDSFGFAEVPGFLKDKNVSLTKETNSNVGKTLAEYGANYIDKDVWETEVDMCVVFVLDLEEPIKDTYDRFLNFLAENIVIKEENIDSFTCDFSGFFENHKDKLRSLYKAAGWRLEPEFDDDEIHYDFVSSVIPSMISGNADENSYKLFMETFEKDESKSLNKEKLTLKAFLSGHEINQDYMIISSLPTKVNGIDSVIGYDPYAPNPYVVWSRYKVKNDDAFRYSSGTYLNSIYEAAKKQAEMAESKHLKNDMFDLVYMTLNLNHQLDDSLSKSVYKSFNMPELVMDCVDRWRDWDKTLDDDIRDFNTLDSMNEYIEDNIYDLSDAIDDGLGSGKCDEGKSL